MYIEGVPRIARMAVHYVLKSMAAANTYPPHHPVLSKSRQNLQAALLYFEAPVALLDNVTDRIWPVKSDTPSENPLQRVVRPG